MSYDLQGNSQTSVGPVTFIAPFHLSCAQETLWGDYIIVDEDDLGRLFVLTDEIPGFTTMQEVGNYGGPWSTAELILASLRNA
jgi:hypothetical protein